MNNKNGPQQQTENYFFENDHCLMQFRMTYVNAINRKNYYG
jgi:hypothetical protein